MLVPGSGGLLLHLLILLGCNVWQTADKSDEVPDRLIVVRWSEGWHAGHFDAVLRDQNRFPLSQVRAACARSGARGRNPLPAALRILPGAP